MTLEYRQQLEEAHINVESAVARFMGNELLFVKFLKRFSQDACFQNLITALEDESTEAAFQAAHTLKGVAGNLSFTELHHAILPMVECLRVGNLEEAKKYRADVEKNYFLVIKAIGE